VARHRWIGQNWFEGQNCKRGCTRRFILLRGQNRNLLILRRPKLLLSIYFIKQKQCVKWLKFIF